MEERLITVDPNLREWINIFDYIFQRGRVGESNGIVFIIHTREKGHNKPHLHAEYQQYAVVLEIPTGKVIEGNLPPKKLKMASRWVAEHQDYLEEQWDLLVDGVRCFG
ncbi:MAG TPA: DUF4160 domain-containing protein [Collinsella ihuae]|uniref:DUF4160 domain-containing protein n=1 Tax=Collinsella ihumii TaxID=1720204 RepID=A0A921LR17_9ACTN|nr:DUF4160 domain-containing protein [Collinsella ihumii]